MRRRKSGCRADLSFRVCGWCLRSLGREAWEAPGSPGSVPGSSPPGPRGAQLAESRESLSSPPGGSPRPSLCRQSPHPEAEGELLLVLPRSDAPCREQGLSTSASTGEDAAWSPRYWI